MNPQQNKDKLPHADFIDERADEMMSILMQRNSKAFNKRDLGEIKDAIGACDRTGVIPMDKEVLLRWLKEEATEQNDAKVTKDFSRFVAARYNDVLDERMIPSVAAKWLLQNWDVHDEADVKMLFPEHEREERKRRLEKYIDMMQNLEDKYDHGKIPNPHAHINNYHYDEPTEETNPDVPK